MHSLQMHSFEMSKSTFVLRYAMCNLALSTSTTTKEVRDCLAETFGNPTRGHIHQLKDQIKSCIRKKWLANNQLWQSSSFWEAHGSRRSHRPRIIRILFPKNHEEHHEEQKPLSINRTIFTNKFNGFEHEICSSWCFSAPDCFAYRVLFSK